jgi:hypothetical protein
MEISDISYAHHDFKVGMTEGPMVERKGYVVVHRKTREPLAPGLAVGRMQPDNPDSHWAVTHLNSGMSVMWHSRHTMKSALHQAVLISTIIDWDELEDPEAITPADMEAVRRICQMESWELLAELRRVELLLD